MRRYPTLVFDVGGTLLRFNLEALARVYLDASLAQGVALDFARTCAALEALERELPVHSRQRLISLEGDNGKNFWDDFYSDGFRRLGVTGDMSAAVTGIRERFQRGEFDTLF